MMLLVTTTLPQVIELRESLGDRIGSLVTPRRMSGVERCGEAGIPWAADNGAFGGWDPDLFRRLLVRLVDVPACRFVAVPDVVADAGATLERFERWAPKIREIADQPLALVAQDGLTAGEVPWDELGALFIGGSTEFKLGAAARELGFEAKRRGLWLHVGRVNSIARARYCASIGADSIDGMKYARFFRSYPGQVAAVVASFDKVNAWKGEAR